MKTGVDVIAGRIKMLGSLLRRELARLPGVTVLDLGVARCGIVSFMKDDEMPDQTQARPSARNINVHVSRSPQVPALDLPTRGLRSLVRASVHYYNDETEVECFVQLLADYQC